MTEHTTVKVIIQGAEYSFKTDDPEYIKKLAEFVDKQIENVTSSDIAIAPAKALTLAAFNIADELFRLQSENAKLSEEVSRRLDTMLDMAEETYRSTGEVGETG
jgi:cell division protein ZapA (FtsZ GTPase activity inhibitor)